MTSQNCGPAPVKLLNEDKIGAYLVISLSIIIMCTIDVYYDEKGVMINSSVSKLAKSIFDNQKSARPIGSQMIIFQDFIDNLNANKHRYRITEDQVELAKKIYLTSTTALIPKLIQNVYTEWSVVKGHSARGLAEAWIKLLPRMLEASRAVSGDVINIYMFHKADIDKLLFSE